MLLKYSGTNDQGCKFPADGLVSVAVVRKRTKWRLFVAYSRVAGKLDVSNGAPPTSIVPRFKPGKALREAVDLPTDEVAPARTESGKMKVR